MGILELIEQFEDEFYPISEEKKSLLACQIWLAGRLAEVGYHGN